MNRIECVEAFSRVRAGALVIVSPGFTGHELAKAGHDDRTIYNMEMGYAAPMCLGLALARPDQRVVALEGDGSMLMGLSTFATLARYPAPNLAIVVFDKARYLTTGSGAVETATAHGQRGLAHRSSDHLGRIEHHIRNAEAAQGGLADYPRGAVVVELHTERAVVARNQE